MANKVNNSPNMPIPIALTSIPAISNWATTLIQQLVNELRDHATRLNNTSVQDGTEVPTAPVRLNTYVKSALPSAALFTNSLIMVSNDTGGITPAFSDGTNWRRTADRNIIS